MSRDLKDLIDEAEEEQESRAYLEKTIEKLEFEVTKLRNKLEAQKASIKVEPVKHIEERSESEEIKFLKDMISTLTQKLEQKNDEKEQLQKKVEDLTLELDNAKERLSDTIKDELLSRTQNSLNTLIQDYGKLEKENKSLKKKLFELEKEIEQTSQALMSEKSESNINEQLKSEIFSLEQKISNLMKTNQLLKEDLEALSTKKDSVENLDRIVDTLKKSNLELEEENRILSEKLDVLKREKLKMLKYESKIADLNRQIENLQEKNRELREKDSILLAKTITALQLHDKKELQIPKPKLTQPIQISKVSSEVKEEKLMEMELESPKEFQEETEIIATEIDDTSELVSKSVEIIESEEDEVIRKWQCPKCGNNNKAQIREIDDKTRLIYAYPKIYAKKYQCGQCAAEWR
ncbi:MAG: hypothetical protein ACFE8M_04920 [Candidatus Hermodarchaeota archaeon]